MKDKDLYLKEITTIWDRNVPTDSAICMMVKLQTELLLDIRELLNNSKEASAETILKMKSHD